MDTQGKAERWYPISVLAVLNLIGAITLSAGKWPWIVEQSWAVILVVLSLNCVIYCLLYKRMCFKTTDITKNYITFSPIICLLILNLIWILSLIVWQSSRLWAIAIPVILALNYGLYRVLSAQSIAISDELPEIVASNISKEKVSKGMQLLKYAAASLAIISFITTANGFKSFVFVDTNGWSDFFAYIASFATQSFLIVFSLLFLHIRQVLKNVPKGKLSDRMKSAVLFAIVLLFTLSIIASSSFSYVFISNNMYKTMLAKNSNITIERFLREQTAKLKNVNDAVGEKLKKQVEEQTNEFAKSNLALQKEEVQNVQEKIKDGQLKKTIRADSFYTEEDRDNNIASHEKYRASYNNTYTALRSIYDTYSNYYDEYEDAFQFLNQVSTNQELKNRYRTLVALYENYSKWCDTQLANIDSFNTNVIDQLQTYRGNAKLQLKDLSSGIEKLLFVYEDLLNTTSGSEVKDSSSIMTEADVIRKMYYVIYGKDASTDISDDDLSAISNLVSDWISQEMEKSLSNDSDTGEVSTVRLKSLSEFLATFNSYVRYRELSIKIENYLNTDLSTTYYILKDNQTSPAPQNGSKIKYVTENEWCEVRKRDFIKFVDCLNDLPDLSQYQESITEDNYTKIIMDYSVPDIMTEAYTYNRDLLEDISGFEKALNYFKYDFRLTAIVSLIMALFFDVVSSLAGGFMFAATFFPTSKKTKELPISPPLNHADT